MQHRHLGQSGLSTAPVVLGGNVFGWSVDREKSFRLLDQFLDAGFNAIDTADVYSRWVDGNEGGESESLIGEWLAQDPARRDKVTLITKVGSDMGGQDAAGKPRKGLSQRWIEQAVEDSLRRLRTDRIDLYFSHWPDDETEEAETLAAYGRLMQAGKIRAIGASNYDAERLRRALDLARGGLPRYEVIQPEYNLYDRGDYEGPLQALAQEEGLGVITYFSLASGFLTGKYRKPEDGEGRARSGVADRYLNARGEAILAALDAVAAEHDVTQAEVALAWLMAKPGVTAPIASATSESQMETLVKSAGLELTEAEMQRLDAAGAPT
ncbi:aldo/keto reductase [Pseudoroseicyclus aestuarii]|uniref:Aryl-alcohol dehydrogenase-like predicted oxidoreductase n=1 Tax=Pseudoroseicyclus aestuarii TaxID=1795041 RepID=A0A318SMK4_9RHOB|nr:aldo/keto reductase [Pseudoroseicyclus aestuarii]PYE80905.1 aryl-alcohol dehydrogenase-like predicted oxidoreductase [Pseudoroseicyclus aestuarii]